MDSCSFHAIATGYSLVCHHLANPFSDYRAHHLANPFLDLQTKGIVEGGLSCIHVAPFDKIERLKSIIEQKKPSHIQTALRTIPA